MPRKKTEKQEPQYRYDQQEIAILETLLANLEGTDNRLPEMGEYCYLPEDVPEHLPFHRKLLELFYLYTEHPSRDTLLNHLVMEKEPDAEKKLDAVLAKKTEDGSVMSLAFPLYRRSERLKMIHAQRKGLALTEGPDADNAEVYQGALDMMLAARPASATQASRLGQVEMMRHWRKTIERQHSRKGYRARLLWPLPALNLLLPPPNPSDIILLTAQSKSGKTTTKSVFAEQFSWIQGFDVLDVRLETDHATIQERQNARHLLLPVSAQRASWFNPSDDTPRVYSGGDPGAKISLRQMFDEFEAVLEAHAKDRGEIISIHCPLWSIDEMANRIEMERRSSMMKGRQLVVMVDYLNAIPKPRWSKDEYEALSRITEELKRIPETFANTEWPIYLWVLDQERNERETGDQWEISDDPKEIAKKLKSTRTRGSGKGVIRSQVHLSLQRPIAQSDAPVYESGIQLQNALLQPRFYHRTGDLSGHGWIFVAHANDAGMGGWVDTLIENELYRVKESDVQSCPKVIDLIREQEALKHRLGL